MSRVSRQLSIHFYTKGFKGIKHDEILTEISNQIDIGSIQITEKDCIVSLKDVESKDKLVVNGITVRNRSVNFFDVEKSITHVTIKDAPYELDDCYNGTPDNWKKKYRTARDIVKQTMTEAHDRYFRANACPNEPYCSYCNIKGYHRQDCESFKHDQEKEEYGKYGPEIFEARQENKSDAHSDCDNDTFSEDGKNDTANSLDLAAQKTDSHKVDKVAICPGTNDISKHKDDIDQINLLVTKAVAQVKSAYPESHVGLCSIIPRKGNSAQINRLNQSATNVNKFIRKLCAREDNVDFVDLEKLLYRYGTIIRSRTKSTTAVFI
ncbi:unnamed protein product [Mytilus coruscus]|uniref:SGNH hydrolase-type esterase domain-containing protein n=1 Tax=Mytilus coruscus TaxID=42192 RepID=A0A6J8EAN7_MYTCO|nr:unnamed protein product [Mytilus coruscus]